jgi:hypothetical protein
MFQQELGVARGARACGLSPRRLRFAELSRVAWRDRLSRSFGSGALRYPRLQARRVEHDAILAGVGAAWLPDYKRRVFSTV